MPSRRHQQIDHTRTRTAVLRQPIGVECKPSAVLADASASRQSSMSERRVEIALLAEGTGLLACLRFLGIRWSMFAPACASELFGRLARSKA